MQKRTKLINVRPTRRILDIKGLLTEERDVAEAVGTAGAAKNTRRGPFL